MHCLTNYFKKKQPSWNNYLFLQEEHFPLFLFPHVPLLPSSLPWVFFFLPVAWLGIWNRFSISDTSWKCSLANRNWVWLQKGPAQGSLWKHLGVSYASKNQSCSCRNNSSPLPSPSPCFPFKIKLKKNKMLALFFVKNRWFESAAEGDEGHLTDRGKNPAPRGFWLRHVHLQFVFPNSGQIKNLPAIRGESFKVQSAVLKRICAGLWGRLILLPAPGSSLPCAFSKAKVLACFSVTPYKITNTQSKENNF